MSSRRARPGDADAAMTRESACAALGIPPWATESDARRAYRSLARAFHPDKGGDVARFQAVQRAHEHLSRAWARAAADARPPPSPSTAPPPSVASSSDVAPARDPADLGDDAFAAGDFLRAVEYYDAALAASDDPRVFLSRGRALAALQRWPAALRDADRAAARRGVWLAPRLLRGACLESLGRWRAAARCYRDASRLPVAVAGDTDADADADAPSEGEEPSRTGTRPRVDTERADETVPSDASAVREGFLRATRAIASRDAVAATRGHAAPVTAVAFAPACAVSPADDPVLATASEDGTVRLWRAAKIDGDRTGTERSARLRIDDETSEDSVTSVSWGAREVDGALALVAATVSGALVLWRVGKNASESRDGDAASASASRDSSSSSSSRKSVDFFRVSPAVRLSPRDGGVSSHALDVSARRVAAGHVDGTVRVWCAVTGAASVSPTRRHAATVTSVAFHPAGWQLCSGGGVGDGEGKVWDLAGMTGRAPGSCAHTLRWDAGAVTHVSYAPCGRLIVTATAAPLAAAGRGAFRLLVWSAVSGRLCKWYDAHDAPITALAWNPGTRVRRADRVGEEDPAGRRAVAVVGGDDQDQDQDQDQDEGGAVSFSDVGRNFNALATGCEDGALRLFSVRGDPSGAGAAEHARRRDVDVEVSNANARVRANVPSSARGGAPVDPGAATRVATSPGGGNLAVVDADGTVRVVDAATFAEAKTWTGIDARACDWAPRPVPTTLRREARMDDEDDEDDEDEDDEDDEDEDEDEDEDADADANADANDTSSRSSGSSPSPARSSAVRASFLLLATGGADGWVRVWRVSPTNDHRTWWDAEDGVVPAVGPGARGRADALPASALARLPPERVARALGRIAAPVRIPGTESSLGHDPDDATLATLRLAPGAAADAAARVERWRRAYDAVDAEIARLAAKRAATVRDVFPRLTPARRREENARHAARVAPLRIRRGRLHARIRAGGVLDDESDQEKDDEERRFVEGEV